MNQVERLLVWAIGPVVSEVADFFVELGRMRASAPVAFGAHPLYFTPLFSQSGKCSYETRRQYQPGSPQSRL